MKFEGAEGKLSLLLKNNIIYIQKFSCQQLICTYNYYRQLKSLTFQLKEISNTCIFKHTQMVLFVYTLFTGERQESIKEMYMKLCNY